MGTPPIKLHLSLLAFFSLTLLIQARLNLDPSDSDAFNLFKNDLGFNGQLNTSENPCYSVGIFCKRSSSRFPGNPTVHRVNRIILNSKGLNGFLNPAAIGRFSELKELSLPNNHLVGQIPPEISNCGKLQVLNLRNNRISGKIPSEFSSLVSLRILDLSSNRFSGDLSFLKYLPNLEKIYVSNNLFTGKVPDSLRSLHSLRILDLSENSYLQIPLQKSANGVQNLLPKRYMFAEKSIAPSANKSSNSSSNKSSSNSSSNKSSSNSTSNSHDKNKDKKGKKKKVKGLVIGFIVGVIGGILSGLLFSFIVRFAITCIRGPEKDLGPTIFSPLIKKAADLAFLEEEDGLASLEIIGRGGCGEVYKAELPGSNGKMIAIKKIVNSQIDSADVNGEDSKLLNKKMRQIRSEILTVGRIRHRNLLSLLAHVIRPDCHYLVYEYMKNGSLHDILRQVTEGTRELDWLSRHRIALGVAAGLEYLHMNHSPRIIHRDLKPANILLDDDMEARIADFGLAKSMPDAHTHISTSNVAGTIGYIAPEYHQTLKFTDKCDIYSFGVLLGVLVMGKLPSDDFYQSTEEINQIKWMRNIITSENPRRAIDPNLLGNGYEEQMLLVLKIACFCTADNAKQRPNSKDVRCMLAQLKHQA